MNLQNINYNKKHLIPFVNIAKTSRSIILSLTGIGLIVIQISSGKSCGKTIINELTYKIVMQIYKKYKKTYEKSQQTMNSFDK